LDCGSLLPLFSNSLLLETSGRRVEMEPQQPAAEVLKAAAGCRSLSFLVTDLDFN